MHLSRRSRIFILVIYFIVINILFTLPGTAFPTDDWMNRIWFDKWVHIGIFFGLTVLLAYAFRQPSGKHWAFIIQGASLYGLAIEIIQDRFIANRGFDPWDWVADVIGILLGTWWSKRWEKK